MQGSWDPGDGVTEFRKGRDRTWAYSVRPLRKVPNTPPEEAFWAEEVARRNGLEVWSGLVVSGKVTNAAGKQR